MKRSFATLKHRKIILTTLVSGFLITLPVHADLIRGNVVEVNRGNMPAPVQLAPTQDQYQGGTMQTQSAHVSLQNAQGLLSTNAFQIYRDIVVPIAQQYGVPPELIAAIIQSRNTMWNTIFDEGGGNPGYGLALITEETGRYYGVNQQELFDPKTNINIAAQILAKGMKRNGNDVSKTLNWYMTGNPNMTDPKVIAAADVFKQLTGG